MRRSDLYLLGFAVVGHGIYQFPEADKIKGFTPIPFGHAYPLLSTSRFGTSSVCVGVRTFKTATEKLLNIIREGQQPSDRWKPEIIKICVFLGEAGRNKTVYNNVTATTIPIPISDWTRFLFNVWDKISEVAFKFNGSDFDVLTQEETNLVNGVLMDGDNLQGHYRKLLASPRACNAMISIKCCYMEFELHQKRITEIIKNARNGMRSAKIEENLKRTSSYKKSTDHFGYMMRQLVSKKVLLLNKNGLYSLNKA